MDEKTQNGPKPGMPPTMSSSDDLDQSRKRKLTSQDNHKTSSVDAMILTNPQSNDPPAGSKKKRGRPRKNGDQITNLEEATNNAGSEQGSTSIAWQSAVAPSTSAFKSFSGPRNYRAIAPEPSNYRATTPKPSAAEGSTPQETKAKTETRRQKQNREGQSRFRERQHEMTTALKRKVADAEGHNRELAIRFEEVAGHNEALQKQLRDNGIEPVETDKHSAGGGFDGALGEDLFAAQVVNRSTTQDMEEK